jgi:hypothetical protein
MRSAMTAVHRVAYCCWIISCAKAARCIYACHQPVKQVHSRRLAGHQQQLAVSAPTAAQSSVSDYVAIFLDGKGLEGGQDLLESILC